MLSVCKSRSCRVLAWTLSCSIGTLGGSIQGGIMKGTIFSIYSKVVFHSCSNLVVRVFKGVSLRSLRKDLICINRGYLVDVASILIYSLSGTISASTSRAGLDVVLYAPVIIWMALVHTDLRPAKWLFRCFFLPWGRYHIKHAYISYSTITAQYIWRNFKRLPLNFDVLSLASAPKLFMVLFLTCST